MNEDYEKIKKLRFRDRITSSDVNLINHMHNKYCGHLKKTICWQCPNSIREALFDLLNYVETAEKVVEKKIEKNVSGKSVVKNNKNEPEQSEDDQRF